MTGVCLFDISKCFDTISHSILLQKLSMYGIKQQELKWFSSYLDRRKQAGLCHNELSSFVDVTCGVPQGSVLGPFLFLLFIIDMSQFTTDGCLTNLYADGSMIHASGDNISEVKQKLQNCIKNISSWYKINRLKINIDKTKVMLIGRKAQLKSLNVDNFILNYDDTPLELVENAKYPRTREMFSFYDVVKQASYDESVNACPFLCLFWNPRLYHPAPLPSSITDTASVSARNGAFTGDPLQSLALAHSRAPLFTQPCPHCSHSRAPGEQWARLCAFTLQGCVQAARLCRGSPVALPIACKWHRRRLHCVVAWIGTLQRTLMENRSLSLEHRGTCH